MASLDKKTKIAIVDDEMSFLSLFGAILSREPSFEIYKCLGAKEALLKIPNEIKPDIVLLDIQMPEMDGFEVFERLKKDCVNKMPKIIFLTNLGETIGNVRIDDHFAKDIGADGYIKKITAIDELINKVKEVAVI
ncbi:response regulator transcription factor [Candidatus Wolfebacteria bacterium]|nr:response regulator transcription factor [Candidatus Wolfebacteria bacterium]